MTEIGGMEVHPAADLFPLIPEESQEFKELVKDIEKNGLLEDIEVLPQTNQLLDGRNRLRACLVAGVEPRLVRRYTPEPVAYVISKNLHRRQLTTGQRADVAVRMLPMLEEEAKQRQGARSDLRPNSDGGGRALDQAGHLVGVGRDTVHRMKRLTNEAPEVAEEVRQGSASVNAGYTKAFGGSETTPAERACRALSKLGPKEVAICLSENYLDYASNLLRELNERIST